MLKIDQYEYIRGADRQTHPLIESLLLTYLRTADGIPAAESWINFRELPEGRMYHKVFQSYAHHEQSEKMIDRNTPFNFNYLTNMHAYFLGDCSVSVAMFQIGGCYHGQQIVIVFGSER